MVNAAELRAFLEQPACDASAPTSVRKWARRRGLTMRQVISEFPNALRDLSGFTTQDEIAFRMLVEKASGIEWTKIRRIVAASPSEPVRTTAADEWKELREHVAVGPPLPLANVDLPSRVREFAAELGVLTVEELLNIPVDQVQSQHYVGAHAMSHTIAALRKAISSENVERTPRVPEQGPSWKRLSQLMPPGVAGVPIEKTELPARMKHFAQRLGMQSVGDVVRYFSDRNRSGRGVGRVSIRTSIAVIAQLIDEALAPSVRGSSALDLWFRLLETLRPKQRLAVSLRCGYPIEPLSTEQCAVILDLHRSVVFRLEQTAYEKLRNRSEVGILEDELRQALRKGATTIDALAHDEWWREAANRPAFLAQLFRHLLLNRYSIANVADRRIVVEGSAEQEEARWQTLLTSLRQATFPMSREQLLERVAAHEGSAPTVFLDALTSMLDWDSPETIAGWLPEDAPKPKPIEAYPTVWALWDDRLSILGTRARTIVALHSGALGKPASRREIASLLGWTISAVLGVSKRGTQRMQGDGRLWRNVEERLRSSMADGLVPVEQLEEDPWWSGAAQRVELLSYICRELLDGDLDVLHFNDEYFVVDESASAAPRLN